METGCFGKINDGSAVIGQTDLVNAMTGSANQKCTLPGSVIAFAGCIGPERRNAMNQPVLFKKVQDSIGGRWMGCNAIAVQSFHHP